MQIYKPVMFQSFAKSTLNLHINCVIYVPKLKIPNVSIRVEKEGFGGQRDRKICLVTNPKAENLIPSRDSLIL